MLIDERRCREKYCPAAIDVAQRHLHYRYQITHGVLSAYLISGGFEFQIKLKDSRRLL